MTSNNTPTAAETRLEAVTVEAVCSNRQSAPVARSGKHGGGQWWARDVWHIAAADNKTLCGVDRSDWLSMGRIEMNVDCCKRCAALTQPEPTAQQGDEE